MVFRGGMKPFIVTLETNLPRFRPHLAVLRFVLLPGVSEGDAPAVNGYRMASLMCPCVHPSCLKS